MATSLEQRAIQEHAWLGDPWPDCPITISIEYDAEGRPHTVRRQRFVGGILDEFDGETWALPERNVYGNPFP